VSKINISLRFGARIAIFSYFNKSPEKVKNLIFLNSKKISENLDSKNFLKIKIA